MPNPEIIPAVQLYPVSDPVAASLPVADVDAGTDAKQDAKTDAEPEVKPAKQTKTRLNKLQKRLRRDVGRAIEDFGMIEAGDLCHARYSAQPAKKCAYCV